jgi:hypothetical protein
MSSKFKAHKPKARPGSGKGAVAPLQEAPQAAGKAPGEKASKPKELGGPSGPEPTRYGDWERKGICVDF